MPNLTAASVRAAKPGSHSDGNGLILRVLPSGRRRWVWRGTVHGKRRDFGLGSFPQVSLKEARVQAFEYFKVAQSGGNPATLRPGGIPTFQETADRFIEIKRAKWKPGGQSEENWRASLASYVFPKIGHRPVNEITSADVLACLRPIWFTKAVTAKRLRQRISAIMRLAIAEGHRFDDPAAAVHMALGDNTTRPEHLRALHHSQVGEALTEVREASTYPTARLAFEFAVLTAARSSEVRGARWSEIDFTEALWQIPAERMKAGRPHRVPLSDRTLHVLVEARKHKGRSGLVFPTPGDREIQRGQLSRMAGKVGGTLHGMRAAFRSWCAETAVDREVAEACLAHQVGNAAERAYQRADLLEQRRELMDRWGAYVGN